MWDYSTAVEAWCFLIFFRSKSTGIAGLCIALHFWTSLGIGLINSSRQGSRMNQAVPPTAWALHCNSFARTNLDGPHHVITVTQNPLPCMCPAPPPVRTTIMPHSCWMQRFRSCSLCPCLSKSSTSTPSFSIVSHNIFSSGGMEHSTSIRLTGLLGWEPRATNFQSLCDKFVYTFDSEFSDLILCILGCWWECDIKSPWVSYEVWRGSNSATVLLVNWWLMKHWWASDSIIQNICSLNLKSRVSNASL